MLLVSLNSQHIFQPHDHRHIDHTWVDYVSKKIHQACTSYQLMALQQDELELHLQLYCEFNTLKNHYPNHGTKGELQNVWEL